MFDINHYIGGDISTGNTGDLAKIDGTVKGQQRVLRRLLTNPGDYIWHTNYGGGLGQKVGTNATLDEIDAVIRGQMALEAAVAKNPPALITLTPINNGLAVHIQYSDAVSKTPQILSFNINK